MRYLPMPKKYVIFIKKFRQHIITIIFIIIALIALLFININPIATIWICIIVIILLILSFVISYVSSLFFSKKLQKTLREYNKVDDRLVARKIKQPLKKIQEQMFKLSQSQHEKDYLIGFMEKHYIYFHPCVINKFNELYGNGKNEKEMLEGLKDFNLETRAEIKIIRDTLIKLQRIEERKKSE